MTKTKSECVDTARQALNLFSGDELEDYINQVATRTRELERDGAPFPRNAAIKEINKGHLEGMLEDSARAARNMNKYDKGKAKIDEDVPMQSLLEKTNKNTDYNVETSANARNQTLHTASFGEMSREELEILTKGEMDDQISAVAEGTSTNDPMIKKIAESLRSYIDKRNAMLIQADAMKVSELNEDRFFRNTYNPSDLVSMGKENWVKLHKSLIDIERTFRNTKAINESGEINEAMVDEMIGNTYDNIIQGNGVFFTKPSVAKDWGKIEKTRHMFYKYKGWSSFNTANNQYGQKSLFKSWLMDIRQSANQAGMADIFGSAPEMMYNELRHVMVRKNPENTPVNAIRNRKTDMLFNNLLGVNKGAYNPTIANIFSSIRNISSMARLFKIVAQSIPDIANIAGMSQRSGFGYWNTYFDSIIHAFNLLPSAERKILAKYHSAGINTYMGAVSRHIDTGNMTGFINKLTNKFFHINLLERFDNSNKLSSMIPVMRGLGNASEKTFVQLNNQQQSFLTRFNIGDNEWDALRSKSEKRMFTVDNVNKLSNDEIKSLWDKSDKLTSLSDYRSDLYRKVFAMFDTLHEFAVLSPTAYTNMFTTLNTRSGTIGGEITRSIMQFKAYPMNYMRRVWVGGMQDFDSYQAKMMYGLNMMLGTVMLASLSEVLSAIADGLTPPDPRQMSNYERFKYFEKILGSGLGVFSTILNDKSDGRTITASLIESPSVRFITRPVIAALALTNGDLKAAERSVKDWAKVANPVGTFPILSNYVDSFLGNKPYLEPGQQPLF